MSYLSLGSYTAFSLQSMFLFGFGMHCNFFFFFLKSSYSNLAIETEINKPLVGGFILLWLVVELCLMFAEAIGTRGFKCL